MWRRNICIVGFAVVVTATGTLAFAIASAAPGHAPLHLGCKHHAHGPKWHAGHSRAIGEPQSRFARPEPDDAPLAERAITSPRGR